MSDVQEGMRATPARIPRLLAAAILCALFAITPGIGLAQPDTSHLWRISDLDRLQSEGKVDSALAVTGEMLARDSLRVDVLLRRAELFRLRGDQEGREQSLRRALTRMPNSHEVNLRLAEYFRDRGRHDSAALASGIAYRYGARMDTRAVTLHAECLNAIGKTDSAIAILKLSWRAAQSQTLGVLPPVIGWRPTPFELAAVGGVRQRWNFGRPSIFLFWATWSPASMEAMADILAALPNSGVSWQFFPMNVDHAGQEAFSDSAAVRAAREIGYRDPVWVDSGLVQMRAFGIERIPALIFTGISGEITQVITKWDDESRLHVQRDQLGGYEDTVRAPTVPPDTARQRARNLLGAARRSWQSGNQTLAIQSASRATHADPTCTPAHLHLALWRWQRGDSAGARLSAENALRADTLDVDALVMRAQMHWSQGNEKSATPMMRRALELDSAAIAAWRHIGWHEAKNGKTDAAEAAIERIRALNPHDWGIPLIRAVLAERRDPERALADWLVLLNRD